jgi:hypothetical protein
MSRITRLYIGKFIAVFFGLIGSCFSQEKLTDGVAISLARDRADIEHLTRRFEKLHRKSDYSQIKDLLCSKVRERYNPEVVERETKSVGVTLDEMNEIAGAQVIGPIAIHNHQHFRDATVQLRIKAEDSTAVRTYFLLKEDEFWKIQLVIPSKLDNFFLRFLSKHTVVKK